MKRLAIAAFILAGLTQPVLAANPQPGQGATGAVSTVVTAVVGSGSSQSIVVTSNVGCAVGGYAQVQDGNAEVTAITSTPGSTQITGVFTNNHPVGSPVICTLSAPTVNTVQGIAGNGAAAGNPVTIAGAGTSGVGILNNNVPSVCDSFAGATSSNNTIINFQGSTLGSYTPTNLAVSAGLRYYICSIKAVILNVTNAPNLVWSYSTSATCASGVTAVGNSFPTDSYTTVGQGYTYGSGMGTIFFIPQGTVPCITSTGATSSIGVTISYRLAP